MGKKPKYQYKYNIKDIAWGRRDQLCSYENDLTLFIANHLFIHQNIKTVVIQST